MVRMSFRWIVLLSCLALFCAQAVAQEDVSKQPKAVFENPEYDFGSVYAGKNVVHDFVIKNTGDAPLVIESVRTG